MDYWEKIQRDIKKNIKEGLEIFKEGGAAVSQRIEELTEEGKKKYKIFTLNMKVQDEFAKLGGKVYDLSFKRKNPMKDRKVNAIISKIKKLETRITSLEKKQKKRVVKSKSRKARQKSSKSR